MKSFIFKSAVSQVACDPRDAKRGSQGAEENLVFSFALDLRVQWGDDSHQGEEHSDWQRAPGTHHLGVRHKDWDPHLQCQWSAKQSGVGGGRL